MFRPRFKILEQKSHELDIFLIKIRISCITKRRIFRKIKLITMFTQEVIKY